MFKKGLLFTILLTVITIIGSIQVPSVNAEKVLPTSTRGPIEKDVKIFVYYGGHNPAYSYDYNYLINDLESNLENSSRFRDYEETLEPTKNIDFNIVDIVVKQETTPQQGVDCEQYLPQIWAGNWTQTDWESTNCWGSGTTDYLGLISQENLCGEFNQGLFDEVWVWAFGYGGLQEYAVAGKYPQLYPIMPNYQDLSCHDEFYLMGFNYEVNTGKALHSFGHRMELAMRYEQGFDFFEQFTGIPGDPNVYNIPPTEPAGRCGHIHLAPNSTNFYEYTNTSNYVLSDCTDWKPDGSGTKELINCSAWNCNEIGYFKRWFKSVPGYNNGLVNVDGITPVANVWGPFMTANGGYGYSENHNLAANFSSNLPRGAIYNYITIQFNDISTGNPVEWQWDFNSDGIVDSTEQNPSYTFGIGTFDVTLKAKDQYGNTSKYVYPNFVTVQGNW